MTRFSSRERRPTLIMTRWTMAQTVTEDPPQQKAPNRVRSLVMFGLKVAVTGAALTWLSRSKSLDFGTLKVLIAQPSLLALDLGVWFLAAVLLTTLRWRILLSLADAHPPFLRLMRFQLIALFFNFVVPGNVGGDVLKAYYVARAEAPEKKPTILLIILVDRLVGLAGLVGVATLGILIRGDVLAHDPRTKPLVYTVIFLALGAFGGPIVFALLMKLAGKTLERWSSGPSKIAALLGQVTKSVRLVSARPLVLLAAVGVSMCIHGLSLTLFTVLTRVINNDANVDIGAVATVFPIGMLSLILPISLSGVGVGHVAFAELYKMIGVDGGATIFNVYLVGQVAPALFGAIPYLLERRAAPQPTS
jgi:uncharacterized protein (TIRG00374 family)